MFTLSAAARTAMPPAMLSHAAETRPSNSKLNMKNHGERGSLTFSHVSEQRAAAVLPKLPLD